MKQRTLSHELLLLSIILLTALGLRLYNLTENSLSNDELSALFRLQFDSFRELVIHGFYVDGHPGGIQVFLYYWTKLFGNSPLSIRLPFALMGVGAVYLMYKTGKQWFGPTAGLVAATAIASLQFPLLYSRIARPYGSGLFFILLLTYFWTQLLKAPQKKGTISLAIAYALTNALCMYNHYFSFLMALIIGCTGLFYLNKNNKTAYLLGAFAAVLLFLPHIPITLNHLSIGGVGEWLATPDLAWVGNHIAYLFNGSWWLAAVYGLLIATLSTYRTKKNTPHYWWLSAVWFLLPLVIGFLYSQLLNPVLMDSVLIFSMPFLFLFLAQFANKPLSFRTSLIIFTLLTTSTLHTVMFNNFFTTQHFNEFKDVAKNTETLTAQYGKENIAYGISINHPWYIQYYFPDTFDIRYRITDNRGNQDILRLRDSLDKCRTPYFLYAWTKPVPPETDLIIRDRYPTVLFRKTYDGLSEISLYSNIVPHDERSKPVPDTTIRIRKKPAPGDSISYWEIDSTRPFSESIHYSLPVQRKIKAIKIEATAEITTTTEIEGIQLVLALHNPQGETRQWYSSAAKYYLHKGQQGTIFLVRTFEYQTLGPGDEIKVYLYNPKGMTFYISELKLESYVFQ
ncbi:MAG: glycosyltransferase family 39 protein [Bacteroidales bacterium]